MSMNCRGLAQKHKRRDVLNYLKNSLADIIFLQETHITEHTVSYFNTVWPGKCHHSFKTSNSRGTAILMKPTLSYDLISEHGSSEGNFVLVVIKINNNTLTLLNIYGPNDDTPSFYKYIETLIQEVPQDNIVVGGDFNFVMDRTRDSNYQHENNICAKKVFTEITDKYSLIDTWRCKHPHDHEYTWMKHNPLKYGRLDMFFTSEHLLSHIKEATIQPGYRTDHSQINLTLKTFNQQRGPGLWKFNESLLKEEQYLSLVKSCIIDVVQQYAIPVYSKHFTSEPANFREVQFTINIGLFYETLLMQIRGETVKYSKKRQENVVKRKRRRVKKLHTYRASLLSLVQPLI